MKKELYSLYDEKSEFFGAVVAYHNDEDAKRSLAGIFTNPGAMKSAMGTHPEDFKLYNVGMFNDNSGLLEATTLPKFVCDLASLNFHNENDGPQLQNGD